MSRKRNERPPENTASSRRLLERTVIKDLSKTNQTHGSKASSATKNIPACSKCGQCDCGEDQEKDCVNDSGSPQGKEVEAIIDSMKTCRELIRTLTNETLDALNQKTNTIGNESCQGSCRLTGDNLTEPTNCSKIKCKPSATVHTSQREPIPGSGFQRRSSSQSYKMPYATSKSPTLSRKSSSRIAQTAFQKREGKLDTQKSFGSDVKKKKSFSRTNSGQVTLQKNKSSNMLSSQKTLSNKSSTCSCNEEMIKQKREDSKSKLQKTTKIADNLHVAKDDVDRVSVTETKKKIDHVNQNETIAMPSSAANICTCQFPPAYSQYFNCTGHVAGNCNCDK